MAHQGYLKIFLSQAKNWVPAAHCDALIERKRMMHTCEIPLGMHSSQEDIDTSIGNLQKLIDKIAPDDFYIWFTYRQVEAGQKSQSIYLVVATAEKGLVNKLICNNDSRKPLDPENKFFNITPRANHVLMIESGHINNSKRPVSFRNTAPIYMHYPDHAERKGKPLSEFKKTADELTAAR